MIYLASPYSHFERAVQHERYLAAVRAVAILFKQGQHVYSPIVHCHAPAEQYSLGHDFTFWAEYNKHMIDLAEYMLVLSVNAAWETSKGIQAEIDYARSLNKAVGLIEVLPSHNEIIDLGEI